jgi:hypothetical protein
MSGRHIARRGLFAGGFLLILAGAAASSAQAADLSGQMFELCRISHEMEAESDLLATISPRPRLAQDPIYDVAEVKYPLLANRIDEVRWQISETPEGIRPLPDSVDWITWALSHDKRGAC